VALALVREGYVVVGVEHGGTTMWDREGGTLEPLDDLTLEGRIVEVRGVMDEVGEIVGEYVREGWQPRMIAWGHSMGVGTMVGAIAGREDVLGVVAHAAPLENPLFSPRLEDVRVPVLMLLAGEDNSILEVGNRFMRMNFEGLGEGVRGWLVEVGDAGHWSFSDVPGLVEELAPGCGDAVRQTNGEPFSYLGAEVGRRLAAEWTVFFVNEVSGRSVGEPEEGSGVLVVRRGPGE
jgi:hypothetical protein